MKPGDKLIDMEGQEEQGYGPGTLMTNEVLDELFNNHSWQCPPILIPNEFGQDPINVLDALHLHPKGSPERREQDRKNKKEGSKGYSLPVSLYPPQWDKMELVRKTIVDCARQNQVELVRNKLKTNVGPRTHPHFWLSCKYGMKKQKEKQFVYKSTDPVYTGATKHGVPMAEYQPGIRQERLVGKNQAIRGTKGSGKKEPKWSGSEKIKDGVPLCPVKIRVNLDPGVCWYIPFQEHKNTCHCSHLQPKDAGEITSHAKRVPEEDAKLAKVLGSHIGNGHVTQNCIKGVTGNHYSHSTLGTLSKDPKTKNKSNAAQLIDYLNEQVDEGNMRYVAMYHVVDDNTLVAVGASQKREELLKRKMKEAIDRKAKGETVEEGEPTLTEEELTELAGDLVKDGLKLYHTGRLRKGDKPIPTLKKKMEELLDIGSALDTVQGQLTVSIL
jgi:hypothetical protein